MTVRGRSLVLALALAAELLVLGPLLIAYHQTQPPEVSPQVPVTQVPGSNPTAAPNVPSVPAVPVKEIPSPAAPTHALEAGIWGIGAAYLMEYLKKTKWFYFLTPETPARIKAAIGFFLAVATAAGIHFSVVGSLADPTGATLTIGGLSFSAFKDVFWQWIAQQAAYDGLVKDSKG